MYLFVQIVNDYINLIKKYQKLEQALKDCVAVMEPEIMALGDYKEHHIMYQEYVDAKQVLEENMDSSPEQKNSEIIKNDAIEEKISKLQSMLEKDTNVIKLKVQKHDDREKIVMALIDSGYRVWVERVKDYFSPDIYFVCFEWRQ